MRKTFGIAIKENLLHFAFIYIESGPGRDNFTDYGTSHSYTQKKCLAKGQNQPWAVTLLTGPFCIFLYVFTEKKKKKLICEIFFCLKGAGVVMSLITSSLFASFAWLYIFFRNFFAGRGTSFSSEFGNMLNELQRNL